MTDIVLDLSKLYDALGQVQLQQDEGDVVAARELIAQARTRLQRVVDMQTLRLLKYGEITDVQKMEAKA